MHACMGDTWVLALALGGGSKRARKEGRDRGAGVVSVGSFFFCVPYVLTLLGRLWWFAVWM